MRTIALAAVLLLPVAGPTFAADDAPTEIRAEVGEDVPLAGYRPICDDPSIATITAEGTGKLRALKVGETTCSVSAGSPLGLRRIYRVVVLPRGAKRPDGKGRGGGKG